MLVNTEGAAQAGVTSTGGGKGEGVGDGQPLDPLQPPPSVPPSPPNAMGAEDETEVQQYHAVCTSADVVSCMPPCNVKHHGYELLATINGMDSQFNCNMAHGMFSWMGAASEGGYLGCDLESFFSAVVSSAAGFYALTLAESAGITTLLTVRPGQVVVINGDPLFFERPHW